MIEKCSFNNSGFEADGSCQVSDDQLPYKVIELHLILRRPALPLYHIGILIAASFSTVTFAMMCRVTLGARPMGVVSWHLMDTAPTLAMALARHLPHSLCAIFVGS
jgi:hypothetical protein